MKTQSKSLLLYTKSRLCNSTLFIKRVLFRFRSNTERKSNNLISCFFFEEDLYCGALFVLIRMFVISYGIEKKDESIHTSIRHFERKI